MEEVLVSVIIPVYNSSGTIGRALTSVLAQDVSLEVLVIDDASTDDLESALAPYGEDPRLRLLRNETGLGVAASRNRGVQAARGSYIAFLDADDWWEAGKLTRQLAVMREREVVLCCTGRELMRSDGTSTGRMIPVRETITYRNLLAHNCINCSSVLLRADVARQFPMEHDEAHEDYILWLKILRRYGKAAGIRHPYLKYRLSSRSKSGGKLHSARMTYRVYRCVGYGPACSLCFFCSYALHGIWKYSHGLIHRSGTKGGAEDRETGKGRKK